MLSPVPPTSLIKPNLFGASNNKGTTSPSIQDYNFTISELEDRVHLKSRLLEGNTLSVQQSEDRSQTERMENVEDNSNMSSPMESINEPQGSVHDYGTKAPCVDQKQLDLELIPKSTPPSTFICFPKLPTELQLKVWEFAYSRDRVFVTRVQRCWDNKDGPMYKNNPTTTRYATTRKIPRPLNIDALACKQSLEVYHKLSENSVKTFDFHNDILSLDCCDMMKGADLISRDVEISSVHRLALTEYSLVRPLRCAGRPEARRVADQITVFTQLQELILVDPWFLWTPRISIGGKLSEPCETEEGPISDGEQWRLMWVGTADFEEALKAAAKDHMGPELQRSVWWDDPKVICMKEEEFWEWS